MAYRGSSYITDRRYYVVPRVDNPGHDGETKYYVEDCDDILDAAPYVGGRRLRTHGRRPHLHNDNEGDYAEERIESDGRIRDETSDSAVVSRSLLRTRRPLVAFPANDFDYSKQNSHGQIPGQLRAAGFSRIISDRDKNQLGLSYHPRDDMGTFVRAEQRGAFVADYRRDTGDKPSSSYGGGGGGSSYGGGGGGSSYGGRAGESSSRHSRDEYRESSSRDYSGVLDDGDSWSREPEDSGPRYSGSGARRHSAY